MGNRMAVALGESSEPGKSRALSSTRDFALVVLSGLSLGPVADGES